jgi:hypothetical protein
MVFRGVCHADIPPRISPIIIYWVGVRKKRIMRKKGHPLLNLLKLLKKGQWFRLGPLIIVALRGLHEVIFSGIVNKIGDMRGCGQSGLDRHIKTL